MAQYTMYFKDALEADPDIEGRILAEYPLDDEAYRSRLNKLIKDQFWNREIGQETVSMFKLALSRKLDQIMPYYNEQYRASLIQKNLDPLTTILMENKGTSTGKTQATGESGSESDADSGSRAVASQFPQAMLQNNQDYATSAQDTNSKTKSNSKATEQNTTDQNQESLSIVKGSQGHLSSLILRHRQALVNVDAMLLEELEECFFQLFSNSDSFADNNQIGYLGYGNGFFGFGFGSWWR